MVLPPYTKRCNLLSCGEEFGQEFTLRIKKRKTFLLKLFIFRWTFWNAI